LDLTNTYPEIPAELRGGQLADGFSALTREGTREPTPFFQAKGIAPAAGFASTAEDLAKFASWQFRLTPGHDEVLNATTLDEMQRVHYVDPGWETFWGLGFSVQRHDDRTFVGHGGSCPGFRTELSMQKDDKIAVVFMANAMVNTSTYISGMYDLVADAIRGAAKGGGEASAAADTVTVPDLEPYLGTYSQQPWGGETAALRWKGGLAFMTLPTGNPSEAMTRLRWVEGDLFRRIRDDDELGEDIVFERDASGRVTGYRRFGNLSPRVR
ncbi:MAG: serine hydrolase, partial [Gemmatimonadota bacterium]